MNIRSEKKRQNDIYLQEPIGIDREGNEITLLDIVKSNDECVHDEVFLKMQGKRLHERLESELDEKEKNIIELRYGLIDGKKIPQREIAEMMGISRSYVYGLAYCKQ